MDFRLQTALFVGKLTAGLIRKLGKSGATAAPGLYALKIDPNLVKKLSQRIKLYSIVISGTNGKTTTARMLASIVEQEGLKVIHNRAGSNLLRGIASALVDKAGWFGKIEDDIAIWETDEAVMPIAVSQTDPKVLVISNLFRDQLDRYGEIDKLRKIWTKTASKLDKKKILIINSDDPQVANLGNKTSAKVYYFGITDQSTGQQSLPPVTDAKFCPNCQTPLVYQAVYVYHMGKYQCPKCAFKHPKVTVTTDKITKISPESAQFELKTQEGSTKIDLMVGGLYNIYNALAAATTSQSIGISLDNIKKGLAKFKAVFGRIEKFNIDGKVISLYLVKNPAGFSAVINTLFTEKDKKDVLIAINDLIADGTDVSWLWDVDFSIMRTKTNKLFLTGKRADDMALRLKYDRVDNFSLIDNDFQTTIIKGVKNCSKKLYVLPTYTAMLEIRKILNQMGHGVKFWED
ncbi:MAG: hypothetical protein UU05_C0007G0012 [Candidatus Curtissbacteria bacterium GW2011_GWA1_40_47]|uniref:Lipid II isoglutaminyl synthase (glutamine-hydrolyzing) subunit MurT n=1 Tax=Candidatus Curtissbacteria bacterium RIFOXYA1_FULL_41_14 TaxID=1797737 RepID=A0A1F5HGR3_9BACT|nr:MAG: hypothetical protein UT95_C0028G0014 [Candidatus Curtissbacteria bacterium GW2011_GWB1_40_28]KKR61888.1 MAG: hypothetical protein UU00_C0006G0015 [Microgenomates group bacterium GW2011_GWC1_40_35]KKR65964.1 MAG: hypothetical protein UU05_C0007G0012 [Candidatus Curtissbacteria bacterium GW2011_GWA1_40_47]KKS02160.1 MAG: hypothetical protein UU53_C0003G0019 [Candidatus Curtissbacteria bacterium GW2011_GWC2_41_21]OGD79859.1 MAG: hypothetical protein A2683_03070 [Candidatus Curtissbacteria 